MPTRRKRPQPAPAETHVCTLPADEAPVPPPPPLDETPVQAAEEPPPAITRLLTQAVADSIVSQLHQLTHVVARSNPRFGVVEVHDPLLLPNPGWHAFATLAEVQTFYPGVV